jgi:hypothetical protein
MLLTTQNVERIFLLPQTNSRRRLQQRSIAQYGLRFSSATTADSNILNQLRFTYQSFVNAVKANSVTAAVPGLAAAISAITNGAGAVQGAGGSCCCWLAYLCLGSCVMLHLVWWRLF